MGIAQQVLWIFLPCLAVAQSFSRNEDAFFSTDFGDVFNNNWRVPFDGGFDFDNFFNPWRTWDPNFNVLPEFPPIMNVPRVQVFCDDHKLTLLVEKRTFGVTLTAEEVELGDGCYSNDELPDKLIFVYDFDQCGTTHVIQSGRQTFSNYLRLNLKKTPTTLWQTLSTVYISCTPRRYDTDPVLKQPVNEVHFNIKAMDSSWMKSAESNLYKRGQLINLQVSANARPNRQLFIHSCFVSASPEPQNRPRQTVILNKGCASSLGSPHAVALFAATDRADVVNLMLNTSDLISELHVHCTVVLSDKGVTVASKSCNYIGSESRWEELSGVDVCRCCKSKCKGLSVKNIPDDAKAIVSIGPLVIMEDEGQQNSALPEPQPPKSTSFQEPTKVLDVLHPNDYMEGSSAPQSDASFLDGVVVVSRDQGAKLTLWLPGQVQEESRAFLPSIGRSTRQELASKVENPGLSTNEMIETKDSIKPFYDLNVAALIDGWQIPPKLKEIQKGTWLRRSRMADASPEDADLSILNEVDFSLMLDKKPKLIMVAETQMVPPPCDLDSSRRQTAATVKPDIMQIDPIVRTKLEFSKKADGTKTLSYEEDVRLKEDKLGKSQRTKFEPKLKGLHSTFLTLLRKLDKAE